MPQAFKMFRIVCTITDKSLVYGENYPNPHVWNRFGGPSSRGPWYDRGQWSASAGSFWRTEPTIKSKLHALCCDWERKSAPALYPRFAGQTDDWFAAIPGTLDWSRLDHLRVDQFLVTEFSVSKFSAADFMNISESVAA